MTNEVTRRAVHASGTGLPVAYLLDLVTYQQFQWLFLLGAVIALCLEAVRLFVGLDWWLYEALTREYEQENLAGYALYMIAAAVVAFGFPDHVALPAILMLTIADPLSGLLGSGELRPRKQVSVLTITFTVCLVIAILFVPPVPAVFGAFAATLADGVKPVVRGYVIDDNLTIPIAAALAISFGFWLSTRGVLPPAVG